MESVAVVIVVGHGADPVDACNRGRFAITEREVALERCCPAGKGSGESHVLSFNGICWECYEARDHEGRNGECVGCRVTRKDSTSPSDVEQNSTALNDGDVPDEPKMAARRILEHNSVLPLHHEAGNVEGSKVHPSILIICKVTSSSQMVQARRNIDDQVSVDEDLQLADAIIEVVQIEAIEGQDQR